MFVTAMLAGGGLTVLGFVLGRLPGRHRGPRPTVPKCGCKHHLSMHDLGTGHCHALIDGPGKPVLKADGNPQLNNYGYVQESYEKIQCPCRRYTGPEPLPEVYAKPIAP